MTSGQAIAFVLFALMAAITPGPSNLTLTSTGAAVGIIRGLPALIGQVFGMGVMLFLVSLGLGTLVVRNPIILQGLRWCGVGFLLWLAWEIATAGSSKATGSGAHVGFWQMAGFQWVNPKSWLICAGIVGAYPQVKAGNALEQSLTLAALFVLAALPSCFLWLVAGASAQRFLRGERASRIFNVAMGVLLAGSVLLFIW